MSNTREQKDGRRGELLAAAFRLIAEKGLEGLRTRDIADRVGINISTLHYYFESKEDLVAAVVEFVRERFAERSERLKKEGSADRILAAMLSDDRRRSEVAPDFLTVMQELGLRARRDTKVRAAFRAMHAAWNQHVASVLRQGVREGVFRDDLDPETTARLITSFWIGARVQLGCNPEGFDLDATSRELQRSILTRKR